MKVNFVCVANKLLCIAVDSTLDLHKCPLCGKILSDLKALMVEIFSFISHS